MFKNIPKKLKLRKFSHPVAQWERISLNAGDSGSIPASGRSPGEGNGNPVQYSCLENPKDRGAWETTVHGVTKELDTTWQLKNNKLSRETEKQDSECGKRLTAVRPKRWDTSCIVLVFPFFCTFVIFHETEVESSL